MGLMILLVIYMGLHVFVFIDYTITPEPSESMMLLAASQWIVPPILMILAVPGVARFVKPVVKVGPWTVLGLILIVGCIVCQVLGYPGLWWAWTTMAMLTFVVLVVANSNKDRLGHLDASLLGLMVMFLAMASWEVIYQTGLLFFHEFFGSGAVNYMIVMAEQLLWILPAIVVILILYRRYKYRPRLGGLAVASFIASIVCTIVWFANGMDIPLHWWKGLGPFVNEDVSRYMIMASRASQGCWLLGVTLLFSGGKK